MKQSGHLNPSEHTEPGCPVTSKYERIPPNKQGGVGRQQQQQQPSFLHNNKHTKHTHATLVQNTTLYSRGTTHIK